MKRLILLGLVVFCLVSTAQSNVPGLVNYQGMLRGTGGSPVTDSTYSVDFTIYDDPSAGNTLWTESRTVTTVDGLFSINLGEVTPVPDSVFNDSTRWLGIQINPDPEMTPRQRLTTTGYSFRTEQWTTEGDHIYRYTGKVEIGVDTPSTEARVHIRHVGGDNFGVLVDAGGVSGSEIGLHAGVGQYSSLVKNAYFDAGWHRFDDADGAFLQQIQPDGNVGFYVIDAGLGVIPWNLAMMIDNSGRVGIGTDSPSVETKLHISHTDVDNFGLLIDAHGVSGTEIGLHAGPLRYGSLAKNAYFDAGWWNRFNDSNGAFIQEIEPDGDVEFYVIDSGSGVINFNRSLKIKSSGNVGVGEIEPLADFHVQRTDMLLPSNALTNDDIIVEDDDAVIGLYSGTGGTYGSAIAFGEIDAGVYTNKWAMYRTKTTNGSKLGFSYGLNINYGLNPAIMTLDGPNGRVGIGTTTPSYIVEAATGFDQYSYAHTNGTVGLATYLNSAFSSGMIGTYTNHPFQIYTSNSGPVITFSTGGSASGNVGIGITAPAIKLDVHESAATVARFNRNTSDGVIVALAQGGVTEGGISVAGAVVSYNAFTGSHYGLTNENIEMGELVSLTGVNSNLHNNEKSEIIYGIKKSATANDPACLGAYLALSESTEPQSAENPHMVMAVGNGEMWAVDNGRDILPGDYLISSATAGHAMLDDEAKYPVGHIVARAAEGVNWSEVVEQVDGLKHKKISVLFGNFDRSNTTVLNQTIASQQKRIEDLENRLEKLEAQALRSELQ